MGNSGISPKARRNSRARRLRGHSSGQARQRDSCGRYWRTKVSIDPTNPNGPTKTAANPNSFVYRFVPNNVADLSGGGKLQALRVSIDGQAVEFVNVDTDHPFGDVFSINQLKLHTPGTSWPVQWVTIHDTVTDGTASFDANAAAKKAGATSVQASRKRAVPTRIGFQNVLL